MRSLSFLVLAVSICALQPKSGSTAEDSLDPAMLKKIKRATVRLKVTLNDGSVSQGSGFFGAGPNLVLTNAHVLGMLRWESRKPKKVEVVVNGGEKDEKTYLAQPLGIDADSDLGVLLIRAEGLPEPLPLGKAEDLTETQPVYVFGYPYGDGLGKNITVSKSSVSSIRKHDNGGIAKIQINGGMAPGNSGGPVTDVKGQVVGVSVSGIKGTQINFAIPPRKIHSFLGTRPHRWIYGTPYVEGGVTKMPMTVLVVDPLRNVKTVRIETWTGNAGKDRPSGGKPDDALPGDSARVKSLLEYKDGLAEGAVSLPAPPAAGKALWVQIFLVRKDGSEVWVGARSHRPAALIERTPISLNFQPWTPGIPKLQFATEGEIKVRDTTGADHSIVIKREVEVGRQAGKQAADGSSSGLLSFGNAKLSVKVDGDIVPTPKSQQLMARMNGLRTAITLQRDGQIGQIRPELPRLAPAERVELSERMLEVVQGIDTMIIPLAGAELTTDKPWKSTRPLMVSVLGTPLPAVAELTYRYIGVRPNKGEALLRFDGSVRGMKGGGDDIAGKIEGQVIVDMKTGHTIFSTARLDIDFDPDGSSTASGTFSLSLRPMAGGVAGGGTPGGGTVGGGTPGGGTVGRPGTGTPAGGGPVVGKIEPGKILGGGNDNNVRDEAPKNGLLVGLEIGLGKFGRNDVIRAGRAIYRVGDTESFGEQFGTDTNRVVSVKAKAGYAIGAMTVKAGLTADGLSVTFMKVTADGKLDPTDVYESEWVGGKGGGGPVKLGGDGTPVTGIIGKVNAKDLTGLGLLFKGDKP